MRERAGGLVDGILAGLGFAVLFAAREQVPESAGFWPLTVAQAVSAPVVVLIAMGCRGDGCRGAAPYAGRSSLAPPARPPSGLSCSPAKRGYLTVAGVLASLYPASTVLLAALVLRERMHRAQGVDLGLCAVAVSLVVAG